jgi:hypothetical protein
MQELADSYAKTRQKESNVVIMKEGDLARQK